ncbi:hypothetical protein ES332_A08G283700v1 [Gossypium tomentosum]|uniref:Auxin-responsive protein n=1 Tax=Gossypium tomentosum TaxID=34277 RepID=A0A5D2PLL9_GOSTO|nr:hypothetical protein ES332_A08G283700v1 [Gossypium tomentosum]
MKEGEIQQSLGKAEEKYGRKESESSKVRFNQWKKKQKSMRAEKGNENKKGEQVVGWPPVRSSRKKAINERFRYVKVAMDGAPFLRKVNLQCYSSYNQLLKDFDNLFDCTNKEESKLMDVVKRMEYVPTYEDKDNDWMLVGDVPWKMFVESCRRIRLMKCSDPTVFKLASKGCSSSSSPKC